jgi:hypothetical protein
MVLISPDLGHAREQARGRDCWLVVKAVPVLDRVVQARTKPKKRVTRKTS